MEHDEENINGAPKENRLVSILRTTKRNWCLQIWSLQIKGSDVCPHSQQPLGMKRNTWKHTSIVLCIWISPWPFSPFFWSFNIHILPCHLTSENGFGIKSAWAREFSQSKIRALGNSFALDSRQDRRNFHRVSESSLHRKATTAWEDRHIEEGLCHVCLKSARKQLPSCDPPSNKRSNHKGKRAYSRLLTSCIAPRAWPWFVNKAKPWACRWYKGFIWPQHSSPCFRISKVQWST